jgi:ketosteroid isomerase-like protein
VVEQYLAALNRRDLLMLTAYVTPDVEWYSLLNGQYLQEVAGREALATALKTYYAQNQQTLWTIEQSMLVQQKVVVRERSAWRSAAGPGERISLVVYELRDGRIARISHFLDSP